MMRRISTDAVAGGRGLLRATRWQLIAAVTLIVGYADLWRGGMVASAVCITIGYLVLVPIAVVTMPAIAMIAKRR